MIEVEILQSHYLMFIKQWFGVFFNKKADVNFCSENGLALTQVLNLCTFPYHQIELA